MRHSHLRHLDIKGYHQFITFRTYDSTDDYLKRVLGQNISNNKKQYEADIYLDTSKVGAYLNGEILTLLFNFLKSKDKIFYDLTAFVIMPNHIHLLIKPLKKLSLTMQGIRGASAREINKLLNRKGKFWASDYYDKVVRDERQFELVYSYIKNNSLKLGEAKASLPRFYGIYEEEK
jgi:REP element-mobilizing transposase RayT